ncbi:3907_t:CDS:2 [Acaulospora morrowiae]|uniref:GID complex catalytic subunit 2 n=1 Tax=Acaulospora morrowiae TaxID=94023 RepID=A0A9N9BWG2_9GLOM|nr:3907_t:CDS:2 [Acaulospora morrowiae]
MEGILSSFQTDYKKVENKQLELVPKAVEKIDKLTQTLYETLHQLRSDPENVNENLQNLSRSLENFASQASEEHKEFQKVVSKYEKIVDRKWKQDITIASNPEAFVNKDAVLQRTVALHFIRHGKFMLGNTFIQETGLDLPNSLQMQFVQMYQILDAINNQNLEPALSWARSQRDALERRGSSLEFQLHRLHYIKYLVEQRRDEALMYAKSNFSYFRARHLNEIHRLMGALVYIYKLSSSPYVDLLSEHVWTDIQLAFTRDFCNLLGMSCDSPLYISVTVGATALPTIIKMATIMKEKKNEWSQQDELPVEVPLSDEMRYHSIFACPVSKEQSTEDNPPMMMPCGHVICKESLNKLSSKGNGRFKCPYCPNESMINQAVRVYF